MNFVIMVDKNFVDINQNSIKSDNCLGKKIAELKIFEDIMSLINHDLNIACHFVNTDFYSIIEFIKENPIGNRYFISSDFRLTSLFNVNEFDEMMNFYDLLYDEKFNIILFSEKLIEFIKDNVFTENDFESFINNLDSKFKKDLLEFS